MAQYPKSAGDRVVSSNVLQQVVTEIFSGAGMRSEDAETMGHSLVHSDMRGIHSHGVMRLPNYFNKLTKGGVDPRGTPIVISDRGAAIVIDGNNSMGQIGGTFAMKEAIKRAKEIGVAFVAVRGSNHCGALDWYTMMAAEDELIGLCGTNAVPTMAPIGGLDAIVGNNPLSISVPRAGGKPFVLDFSFGATAHGRIQVFDQKGLPIPDHWAFDSEGNKTTNAAAALKGMIQPIGLHKGIGLGMAVGMLSSLLSGAGYGTESGTLKTGAILGKDGHFFAVINPSFFEDIDVFKSRVDMVIDQVHNSKRRDGVDRLYVPGEIENDQQRASVERIVLAGTTFDDILAVAREVSVDTKALESESI